MYSVIKKRHPTARSPKALMAAQPKHAANTPMERGQTLKKQRPSSASPLSEERRSVLKGQKAEVIPGAGRNHDRIPRKHGPIRSSERPSTNCEERRLSRVRRNYNTDELYVTTGSREEGEQEAASLEAQEREFTAQHKVHGSMLVTYSAGLELQCVVSGSNSCRLTIHDLPSNAKSDEIAEIFTQRGMNRDDFYILSIKAVDTGRLEAQVITKAQEGRAFAIGLDEIQFRNESLRFDISENTSVESFAFEGGNFLQYIPPPSHLRPLHLVSETIIRDNVCPICRDIVVRPVKLGCQHSYCTVCIQHYFTSAAGARIFPLVCMGNEAKCKVPIAIPIIQRFLSNQQYEQVLHVAFSTYMDRHPQNFRYCPTPNCMQVYRVDTKTTMICPSCFVAVCTSCHEAHEGLSCEERRTRKAQEDERHNELWAAMHGVKRCPSCQVWIEKTEGCNHLACLCGAHICWICVKAIPVNKVYKHLGEVHGGAYNGDQNDDRQQALALRNQLDGPDDPVRGPGCGCIIM